MCMLPYSPRYPLPRVEVLWYSVRVLSSNLNLWQVRDALSRKLPFISEDWHISLLVPGDKLIYCLRWRFQTDSSSNVLNLIHHWVIDSLEHAIHVLSFPRDGTLRPVPVHAVLDCPANRVRQQLRLRHQRPRRRVRLRGRQRRKTGSRKFGGSHQLDRCQRFER